MLPQPHSEEREKIVAEAIGGFVREMRLVDAADYIAFLRLDLHANIEDLVNSAAELYFSPGFIEFGQGGAAIVEWSSPPEIVLDLVMRPAGVTINFSLKLMDETATVRLAYISFDNPTQDAEENTRFMRRAIETNTIRARKTKSSAASRKRRSSC